MNDFNIKIYPPLIGAIIDISHIPDVVFADKLVGDGVAIEPFENKIYAPMDGIIKSIHKAKHAITILHETGIEILIHIGLDTVGLNGDGFKLNISANDKVKRGDVMGELDIDLISMKAKSLISPILITDMHNYALNKSIEKFTTINTPIFTITKIDTSNTKAKLPHPKTPLIKSTPIIIKNKNGIHARPAAIISREAGLYDTEVLLEKDDKKVNAKSVTSIFSLSINQNDVIYIHASSQNIINKLTAIINDSIEEIENIKPISNQLINNTEKIENNKYFGMIASNGLCIGKLVKFDEIDFQFETDISNSPQDRAQEHNKLTNAIDIVITQLEQKINSFHTKDKVSRDILSAHLAILKDPELLNKIKDIINNNKTAECAVSETIRQECEVLHKTKNLLLMERATDLKDIKRQILLAMNTKIIQTKHSYDTPSILMAHELTPSDMLNLDDNIVGLISIKGGITSHVAILARAKQIPLLISVHPSVLNLNISSEVVLNGMDGYLDISPSIDEISAIKNTINEKMEVERINNQNAQKPAITKDNVMINCLANIMNVDDKNLLQESGADGVGLFRTEFLYMNHRGEPTLDTQCEIYTSIANTLNGKPFIIRTLDAGGEKPISYLKVSSEINPALGIRGIRLSLEYPEVFIKQLTAILQTNKPSIKIMLPMISTIEEYHETKELINSIIEKHSIKTKYELGVMVEVPSVALLSEIFASDVDFFSIGTNDLTQYTLAIDREHPKLSIKADHLHPAVLRNIQLVVKGASKHNKPVSVCGMMASDKTAIPVLIGLGIRSLSMSINLIPSNKALIRTLNHKECTDIANKCLDMSTAKMVRDYINSHYKNL